MHIRDAQDRIIAEMEELSDWMDRYAWLMTQGDTLEPLPAELMTEEHAIAGCQSAVWVVATPRQGRLHFQGAAEARNTRGMLALVLSVVQDRAPEEIIAADLYFVQATGLATHLSPSRANGLASILARVQSLAAGG